MEKKVDNRALLSKQLEQLRAYSRRREDVERLIEGLKESLLLDFDEAFDFLRTHKLLTNYRDLALVRVVASTLHDWIARAPLSGKRKAQFRRHLGVCEAVQSIFSEIDRRAEPATVWQVDRDRLTLNLLGYLEHASVVSSREYGEFLHGHPEIVLNPDESIQLERVRHDDLREMCDACCLILRQLATKPQSMRQTAVQPKEIEELFALARQKNTIQVFFDNYAYHRWQAVVRGDSVSFRAPHKDILVLEHFIDQAGEASDEVRQIPMMMRRIQLRESLREDPAPETAGMAFGDFLSTDSGTTLLRNTRKITAELREHMRREITEVFDDSAVLRTPDGMFSIRELVDTWTFFTSLAYCGEHWIRARTGPEAPEDYSVFAPVLSPLLLVGLMTTEMKIERGRAEELIAQFETSVRPGRNLDLFFKPLVELADGRIVPSFVCISMGRFYRNVFTIAVQETRLDLSPRGFKPLIDLADRFRRAGFRTATNVKLYASGRQLTDIDLVLLKDRILLLAQVKVVIRPDGPYEYWKVKTKLARAADQLDRVTAAMDQIQGRLLDALGATEEERKTFQRISPFILTNIGNYTGHRLRGFPIVDFDYLKMLLRGGTIGVLRVEKQVITRVAAKHIIAGEQPTGIELMNLINDPRPYYESMFRKPPMVTRTLKVGTFDIQVPAWQVGAEVPRSSSEREHSLKSEDSP